MSDHATPKVLIVIPAYNEEKTVRDILLGLRGLAPNLDRIVVNDGSKDATGKVVAGLGEKQLRLPCNLGYGRALQTGMKYALKQGYEVVISFDADGQHRPEDVLPVLQTLLSRGDDVVIGSRYCGGTPYSTSLSRRLGQMLFSHLTRLLLGKRIYDTTSGFKAIRAPACDVLVRGTFWDFHIEMLVRLTLLGFKVSEHPITVADRAYGQSMHSIRSILEYPLKTLLLTLVAAVDTVLARRSK